jgi:ABC-type phosphate transport system substrate-binding protein
MGFKTVPYKILGILLMMCMLLSCNQLKAQQRGADEFYIIGNTVDIKSASTKHIQSVFRGKYSTWNNKQSVTIVLPSKKNENCQRVAAYLYETNITGMQKFWLSQVFQGRSNAPVFLDSDEEIIEYVEKNPGAIGIIRKVSVSDKLNPTRIIYILN